MYLISWGAPSGHYQPDAQEAAAKRAPDKHRGSKGKKEVQEETNGSVNERLSLWYPSTPSKCFLPHANVGTSDQIQLLEPSLVVPGVCSGKGAKFDAHILQLLEKGRVY